jgi:hypothetical protein
MDIFKAVKALVSIKSILAKSRMSKFVVYFDGQLKCFVAEIQIPCFRGDGISIETDTMQYSLKCIGRGSSVVSAMAAMKIQECVESERNWVRPTHRFESEIKPKYEFDIPSKWNIVMGEAVCPWRNAKDYCTISDKTDSGSFNKCGNSVCKIKAK